MNIFATAGDPTSLYQSMEWDRITKPIKELFHMKGCMRIQSDWEKKIIIFCLNPEERTLLPVLIDTIK